MAIGSRSEAKIPRKRNRQLVKSVFGLLCFMVKNATLDSPYWVPERAFNPMNLLANVLGVGIGLGVIVIVIVMLRVINWTTARLHDFFHWFKYSFMQYYCCTEQKR